MDDVKMLHAQKRRDAHPVCNLKRHQAVGKTLLALKLRGDQSATGQCLSNALSIFKSLDAGKH
jgi:hypothetical protein